MVVNETDLVALDGPAKILARAKGGTILFEEITDINEEGQGRIVRMIDNPGEFSPRFIATMQGEVSGEVDPEMVRSDLYYRLGGATIHAPALRERVDDIQLLSAFFLARAERDGGLQRVVTKEAEQLFRNYSWPGNVRQLENVVKRLSLTARASEITLTEVEQVLGSQPAMNSTLQKGSSDRLSADVERHLRRYFDLHGSVLPPPGLHARILKELEHPLISIALQATGGNQAKCADLLGINRNTLRKKINELDIKVTRRRKLM